MYVETRSKVEDSLAELLQLRKPGQPIVLYEGAWDDWYSHPKGVVIRVGNRFLLNGEKLLYEGAMNGWLSHPKGVVIRVGDRLLLI